ncbi:ABC transporter ATP-binding protein [Candidatus Ruminimicrobium bovinum]|uniref:ABC transporter ATP-binding protein n=1 Tax=Candidatus Ruminimicrobium bovinum TaxID=3242779 RepID=UPI0039B83D99
MLELKNISFDVTVNGQKKEILKDIDIKIGNNKFVAVTGPNGSGKSTLAKIIAGIILPTKGQVFFAGNDITNTSITDRAKAGIGYAFQQPVKFKGLQVYDLLKIASNNNLKTEQACEYLSKVGLCAGKYVGREIDASLSGGELKRIEIATILAKQPKLSVFDEPEAGIDLWSFQNLIKVFNLMRKNINDGTIIVISHQERILSIADEIIVVADGKVTMRGTKDEILPDILGTESVTKTCEKLS